MLLVMHALNNDQTVNNELTVAKAGYIFSFLVYKTLRATVRLFFYFFPIIFF